MGGAKRQAGGLGHAEGFFKKLGARYKRIRKRCKGRPDPDWYAHKREALAELERLSRQSHIDLFYGDETCVSSEGYVPYGWQFAGEDVYVPSAKGHKVNIWGLFSRGNRCHCQTSQTNITARFVLGELERLSLSIRKPTVVVLDQARIHTAGLIRERLAVWQQRGLFVFYLPVCSPQLNMAEIVWRRLKGQWLRPEDYLDGDTLAYAVNRCLANFGGHLKIHFLDFNIS